jgi:hypothetical protein
MPWTLCTKEDVVSITHAPEGALEDFWSASVEDMIRQHMGLPNLGRQAQVLEELHDGKGTNILMVSQPTIVSVEAVRVNGYTLPAAEYVHTPYSIKLRYTTFVPGVLNVSVDYTSGSTMENGEPVVSALVRMTAAAMVTAIWNYRERGGADASIKWGNVSMDDGEQTPNEKVGLTSHLATIMKRMLRRGRLRVY